MTARVAINSCGLTTKRLRRSALLVVIAVAPFSIYGQGVEIPTAKQGSALVEIPTSQTAAGSGEDLTVASEFKSAKNVVEPEKEACWSWYGEDGYVSEYNFRGTNLTPNAAGALYTLADVSKWGFTLGIYDVYQLGTAHADSWSIGESGGSGSGTRFLFSLVPETIQDSLNEIDVFLQYHHEFGPIDVTVGDIGFFIHRDAHTVVTEEFLGIPFGTFLVRTVENERFDRAFVRLSTSVIPHIQPWITYYQTLYSDGHDPGILAGGGFPAVHERNGSLGGYLEGKLRGNFSIGSWADFNPFGIISVSFHDRTEPVENPIKFHDFIRAKTLSGWNVAQAGFEMPIHAFHVVGFSSVPCAAPDIHVDLVPGFTYSHHISRPPIGTERDEFFGGAKIAVTF